MMKKMEKTKVIMEMKIKEVNLIKIMAAMLHKVIILNIKLKMILK